MSEIRSSAAIKETLLYGAGAVYRSAASSFNNNTLILDASLPEVGPQWAVYGFDPQGSPLDSVAVMFDAQPGSSAYIGLADFSTLRWEWQGPYAANKTLAIDGGKYLSPSGQFFCAVLVDAGLSVAVNALSIRQFAGLLPPNAVLEADLNSGPAPLTVQFDAVGSSDPDGQIIQYAWDWDGNGAYEETGSFARIKHTFTTPGDFEVGLRVLDDAGLASKTELLISVKSASDGNLRPHADLSLSVDRGPAPLMVSLNANGASDSDGVIVQYEWDFDGGGTFDSTTTASVFWYSYPEPGAYYPTVRVTDDRGATDITWRQIWISVPYSAADQREKKIEGCSMAMVNGRPAIAYLYPTSGTWPAPNRILCYVHAGDSEGLTWEQPIELGTLSNMNQHTSLAVIDGHPAIAFGAGDSVNYIRALDSDGNAWGPPVTVVTESVPLMLDSEVQLLELSQAPVIVQYMNELRVSRAADSAGDTWNAPVSLGTVLTYTPGQFSAAEVNGALGIAYEEWSDEAIDNRRLEFRRSNDAEGQTWNSAPVVIQDSSWSGNMVALAVINGVPAVSYIEPGGEYRIVYSSAEDADGQSWNAPSTILYFSNPVSNPTQLTEVAGHPAIGLVIGYNAYLFRSVDIAGETWAQGTYVSRATDCAVLENMGRPAICWSTAGDVSPQDECLRFSMQLW